MAVEYDDEEVPRAGSDRRDITMSDDKKPPIDWLGQIGYFALMTVAVVAALMLLRYFGLRG